MKKEELKKLTTEVLQAIVVALFSLLFLGCHSEVESVESASKETTFNQEKWNLKEGNNYPHRENMLDAILYNDSIKTLNKTEIIHLLGTPNKINEAYLYYTISQKRIVLWPLHTKTLVIKMTDNSSQVDWIKVHD